MKTITLLGSTGSVGKNVLDVVRHYPDRFRVKAISSNENISTLVDQASEFKPDTIVVGNEECYNELKRTTPEGIKVSAGSESLEQLASEKDTDIVFMAISGSAALDPLVAALTAGRTVALASKEPVVSAGMLLDKLRKENSSRIIPVDSEHSAIMQCMTGRQSDEVGKLYITGSGGSLKDRHEKDFRKLTVEEVLCHPKWDMGQKITVDSATLMNKGLEVIEARWLFDVPHERIKVIIHPEAIIHSMVEFKDGTITASMFCPDMRFPILKALAFPEILESSFPRVDFSLLKNLTFSEPDTKKFPALRLAFEALREGGTAPAVLTGSNEAAVGLFLGGKIAFTDIIDTVSKVLKKHKRTEVPSLEVIKEAEKWAVEEVLRSC